MVINFSNTADFNKDIIVVGVNGNCQDLPDHLKELDEKTSGAISRAISFQNIDGFGKTIELVAPNGLNCQRLLIVGLGDENLLEQNNLQELGGIICSSLWNKTGNSMLLHFGNLNVGNIENYKVGSYIANGIISKNWKFDKYMTNGARNNIFNVSELTVFTSSINESKECMDELEGISSGISTSKHLATEPPNVLYPDAYANYINDKLPQYDIEVEILDERTMKKLGMNSLLAVGQGSDKDSRLVVMKWNGAGKDDPYYGFVGKGVCFDSGGISIKPSLKMDEMKYDMCGSAAVVGLMEVVAKNKLNKNVVGVVGLVENMPSGSAVKPSDIVTSMSGQTIEILNTDAEGRLVLADALWYIQEKFNPEFIVDLATLTGAIEIALGKEYAGLFSNNDDLALNLFKSGNRTGEKLWRMPLCENFDNAMNSDVADMKNISNTRGAGSSTAGQFLQRFVKCSWAHLDIANVAWNAQSSSNLHRKGATGFGVKLLYDMLCQIKNK